MTTRTYYRAMTKTPGRRTFRFLGFTGATGATREAVEAAIRLAQSLGADVGFEYRIERRDVTVTQTPWRPVR